jgi:hypothetical protein
VIWKKVYGENTDHTNIATAYNNLASNESILNNYDGKKIRRKINFFFFSNTLCLFFEKKKRGS